MSAFMTIAISSASRSLLGQTLGKVKLLKAATLTTSDQKTVNCILITLTDYGVLYSYPDNVPAALFQSFYTDLCQCIPQLELVGLPSSTSVGPTTTGLVSGGYTIRRNPALSTDDSSTIVNCVLTTLVENESLLGQQNFVPTALVRNFVQSVASCLPGVEIVTTGTSQTSSTGSSSSVTLPSGSSTISATSSVSPDSRHCTDKILTDPNVPTYMEKCEYAGCVAARDKGVQQWRDYEKQGKPGGGVFVLRLANSWNGPADFYCDVDSTKCPGENCEDVANPGAWLVQREISAFTAYHTQIYDFLFSTAFLTDTQLSLFSKAIATVPIEDNLWAKIAVAVSKSHDPLRQGADMQKVAGLFGGQILGAIVRSSIFKLNAVAAAANGEYITQSKLFASNIALSGANIGVNLNSPAAQADITGDLSAILGSFFNSTRDAIKTYVQTIFDGTDKSIDEFNTQIGSGVWANPNLFPELAQQDLQTNISTIYYMVLVVPAWQLRQLNPIILYEDKECDPFDKILPLYNGDIMDARTCYDGKTFYIVDYNGHYDIKETTAGGVVLWDFRYTTKALIGIETLDGKTWGVLHHDTLVRSSWDGFKANNFKQPYTAKPLFSEGNTTDDPLSPFGSGYETPGLVNMTVCKITDLYRPVVFTPPNVDFKSSPCPVIPSGYSFDGPGGQETVSSNVVTQTQEPEYCLRTLDALDRRWRSSSRENRNREYGRSLTDTEGTVHLPVTWKLTPTSHGPDPPACEFVIDNARGREEESDSFRLQQVALAVVGVLRDCFGGGGGGGGGGRTGRAYPSLRENVFVEVRYRRFGDGVEEGVGVDGGDEEGGAGFEVGNFTLVEAPGSGEDVVAVGSEATS
ncbi:uncharacterized protein KY384_007488 [Bacidia gigantensis]|uniref:uncharacterized protein n=1 Tax=Bacidia gigantensis TaxID=2732470 RepID=UPI001D054857|nr:uncharacterized protein KY384_007488 [Bacidia gigantensis]KAG8527336.1 hypothetical protein KY384_007488 [Bacidia gigantensis]